MRTESGKSVEMSYYSFILTAIVLVETLSQSIFHFVNTPTLWVTRLDWKAERRERVAAKELLRLLI